VRNPREAQGELETMPVEEPEEQEAVAQ
jgi:hypothetical protein